LTSKNTVGKTLVRRRDRRAYQATRRRLARAIAELHRLPDPIDREDTLLTIAELFDALAARHVPAYGTTTAGHRYAHRKFPITIGGFGRRCRPWWIWWLPPVLIVHATSDNDGRSGGDR
jgi:hypothetical protein